MESYALVMLKLQAKREPMLEKLLESYPKPSGRFHRILPIDLAKHSCIFGAQGIGKTDFILHYFSDTPFQNLKKLYINCDDARLNPKQDLQDLKEFLQKESISVLILDNYHKYPLPLNFTLPFIVLITNTPVSIPHFTNIAMPPITFSEFLTMRKLTKEDGLTLYLKFGNLLESLSEQKKGEFLKAITQDSINFWILRNLILHLGQRVSLHQIYTKLKKDGKLSKDRFYAYCQLLNESGIALWVEKFEHSSAPRKLYFWDFTLRNAVSYERNFGLLFENMVFLELLYRFKTECFYTDKLDFYIPSLSLGILCAPFIQTLEARLNKIGKEREFCDSLLIITLNHTQNGENLGTPYKIIPFSDFIESNLAELAGQMA